jgi:hypothetical protein
MRIPEKRALLHDASNDGDNLWILLPVVGHTMPVKNADFPFGYPTF